MKIRKIPTKKDADENGVATKQRPRAERKSAAWRIAHAVCRKLETGFIGALFTSYKCGDDMAASGKKTKGAAFAAAERISDSLNTGRAVYGMSAAAHKLLGVRLRVFGTFFASFGIYTVLYAFFQNFIASGGRQIYDIFAGIILTVAAFPLIFSDDMLISALTESSFGKALSAVGIDVDADAAKNIKPCGRLNVGFILGVAAGVLSYFASPYKIMLALLIVLLISVTAAKPEFGIVAVSFLIPFSASSVLLLLLAATGVSFIFKLVRGKRYCTFEALDASAFGMLLVILLGGTVSVSDTPYRDSILYAFLAVSYFLAANLLRRRVWLYRMRCALVYGTSFAAGIYILSSLGDAALGGVSEALGDIFGNSLLSSALSGDVGGLRMITVAVLPIALSLVLNYNGANGAHVRNTHALISFFVLLLSTTVGISPYIFVAAACLLLMFILVYTERTLIFIICAGLGTGIVFSLFPSFFERARNVLGVSLESFFSSRLSLWSDAFEKMSSNMFGGIGFGGGSFSTYFESAGGALSEYDHVYNTFLQLWIETGIVGILMFLVFLWLFVSAALTVISQIRTSGPYPYQRSGEAEIAGTGEPRFLQKKFQKRFQKRFQRRERRAALADTFRLSRKISICASVCGVLGLCLVGFFDYIWYDEKVFLMFWLTAGLAAAEIRSARRELRDAEFSYRNETERKNYYEIDIGPDFFDKK